METQFPRSKNIFKTEDGYYWNQCVPDEKMPLTVAVLSANKTVIEEQISAGADINEADKSGHTALHWASKFWNVLADAVDILLKHGANIAARDYAGRTPLHYAARYSREDAATKLLDAGADANAQDVGNYTPLHLAAYGGGVAVIKLLLSRCKTNVNARAKDDITALMVAAARNRVSSGRTIALLIEAGADINLKGVGKATALHVAAEWSNVDAMQTLLRYGADREMLDGFGRSMLHSMLCLWDDSVENFLDTLLQEAETDLNSTAPDGMTLLMTAARYAPSRVVEKLIIAGAALNRIGRGGNTALHWAVRYEKMNTVRVLLKHGANINAQDNRGETPLFLAMRRGIAEVCSLLLRRFAEIYIRDNMGRLPIDVANERRHGDLVFLLNRHPPAAG